MSVSKKQYNCLHCANLCFYSSSKTNKYCDNKCQGAHRWIKETIPKIEAGECREPFTLKKYLIEKFGENCFECGLGSTWQNKPLTLQLEHTDGNSDNNLPQNLKLLCPNCHSQTETFGSRGQGNRYKKITKRNNYLREYKG